MITCTLHTISFSKNRIFASIISVKVDYTDILKLAKILNTTSHQYENDELLWKAFKAGNEDAFSVLFHTYYNDVYFYGLKFSGNEDLVKDTLQELFTEIWLRRQKLGDVKHIKAYLITSLRRKLLKVGKDKKRQLQLTKELGHLNDSFELSIEDFLVSETTIHENKTRLQEILPKLNKTQREIIYLRFYNDMDYKDIATVTNLKYQSVRNSMHKALKFLRNAFVLLFVWCL